MQQIIEKGYKSCFILPNSQGRSLFYVCLRNDDSLNPSFFFHNRSNSKEQQSIKKVEYIEGRDETLPRFAVMKFVDGNSLTLKFAPYFWSRKGIQIKPEEHCTITKDLQDSKLTCKTPNLKGMEYSKKIRFII